MDILFDFPAQGFLFREHCNDAVDNQKCESSAVERWKREKVKNSEINTDESRDQEYDRKCHLRREKIHKEVSDGDRPTETLNRFRSFRRNSRSKYPLHESPKEFQSHRRLFIGFDSSLFERFKETILITKILSNLGNIIPHITSYFPTLWSH